MIACWQDHLAIRIILPSGGEMRAPASGGAYVVRAGPREFTRLGLVQRPCFAELLTSDVEQRHCHADSTFEQRHLLFLQELKAVHAVLSLVEGDGRAPRVDGRARDVFFRVTPPVSGEAVRRD